MRWQRLFADLEAQLDAEAQAGLAAEVADRTRREVALVALHDRLRAAAGTTVRIDLVGAGQVEGTVHRVGPDWSLLRASRGVELVVAGDAITAVRGAPLASRPAGTVDARIDLRHVLRGLARDRRAVGITTREGVLIHGSVERVGADWLDVAVRAPGEQHAGDAQAALTLALAAIAVIRAPG